MIRQRATWVVLGTLGGLLAATGGLAWYLLGHGSPNHWDEVARARRFLDQGRPDLAFQAVSQIRDEAPGAAEGLTLAAQALLTQGQIALARRTLEHSLTIQPEQADAAKMLAAIYLASGDGRRGLDLLERAARLDPDDFRPWFAMGRVRMDLGEFAESANAYTEALRREPPEAEAREARIGRVRALLDANRDAEAQDALAEARALLPDDPELLGLAARHANRRGDSAEARALADRALAVDPDNFDARLTRGTENHFAGRLDDAVADLEHALRINPNHLGALQLLIQVHFRQGHAEQAEAARQAFRAVSERLTLMDELTREIEKNPSDPEPRYRMGRAALEGGMTTLAQQCFQAALDVDPSFNAARGALASLRAGQQLDAGKAGATPSRTRN